MKKTIIILSMLLLLAYPVTAWDCWVDNIPEDAVTLHVKECVSSMGNQYCYPLRTPINITGYPSFPIHMHYNNTDYIDYWFVYEDGSNSSHYTVFEPENTTEETTEEVDPLVFYIIVIVIIGIVVVGLIWIKRKK